MTEEQKVRPRYAKQVIAVRTDLKMNAGKIAAQVSHASMAAITNRLRSAQVVDEESGDVTMSMTFSDFTEHDDAFKEWITGSFTKVVVEVNSEEELLALCADAEMGDVPVVKIIDEGRTVFKGVKTLTCASFGPCYNDILDDITGHLKLLR